MNSLELFGIGYSWGGFESLAILQEIKSSKKDEYLKGRQFNRFDKDEYIVRLHIGLEDPKDLINDLSYISFWPKKYKSVWAPTKLLYML